MDEEKTGLTRRSTTESPSNWRPAFSRMSARWEALGRIGSLAVYDVVHVYREYTYGKEITRIISAREAEKSEVRKYLEQAAD